MCYHVLVICDLVTSSLVWSSFIMLILLNFLFTIYVCSLHVMGLWPNRFFIYSGALGFCTTWGHAVNELLTQSYSLMDVWVFVATRSITEASGGDQATTMLIFLPLHALLVHSLTSFTWVWLIFQPHLILFLGIRNLLILKLNTSFLTNTCCLVSMFCLLSRPQSVRLTFIVLYATVALVLDSGAVLNGDC